MLIYSVISPRIFSAQTDIDQAFCLALLKQLSIKGVIFVDDQNQILQAIDQALDDWPVKFRKPCREVLTYLEKHHRIVRVQLSQLTRELPCKQQPCLNSLRVAHAINARCACVPNDCATCARDSLQALSTQILTPGDFSVSPAFLEFAKQDVRLKDGQWDASTFSARILEPVFRYAKSVKIIDRNILVDEAKDKPTSGDFIRDNYRASLEWVLSVFAATNSDPMACPFEVYSIVRAYNPATMRAGVKKFSADMSRKHNVIFRVIPKIENSHIRMQHDRYIITNQVAIAIGRGFDLLWSDEHMVRQGFDPKIHSVKVRDTFIACCTHDVGDLVTHARSLPEPR